MRILYVAMTKSIHVARFLNQVNDLNWDLHLFNSAPDWEGAHPSLKNVTLHGCRYWKLPGGLHSTVKTSGFWPFRRGFGIAHMFVDRILKIHDGCARKLAWLITTLQPDIIHSHEIQHSGYLMTEAIKYVEGQLPPWIVTNWGSDIYFFGQLKDHQPRIRRVLEICDYYTCETERDLALAESNGFSGKLLMPVMPNPGGFRFEEVEHLRQSGSTSKRRVILLKGHQGTFGRALNALYAFELCKDVLKDYKILIYSADKEVTMMAEILADSSKLDIQILPHTNTYDDMLRIRGQARVSIGLSVSDAASISFLEALVMGSFPIQSNRGGSHEWIKDGESGFIVHPEDPHVLAAALRRAVTDDDLVDRAAAINDRTARERLDFYQLRQHVIDWYQQIVGQFDQTSRPAPSAYGIKSAGKDNPAFAA